MKSHALMNRFLPILLIFSLLLPGFGAMADDALPEPANVYAEQTLSLPSGYTSPTAMVVAPDGSVVVAAKDADEKWALLTYADLNAAPEIVMLALEEGEEIASIDVTPDGQVMATLALVINTQGTTTMQSGNASVSVSGGAQAVPAGNGDSASTSGNDGNATPGGNGGGGNQMMSINNMKTTVIWFADDGSKAATFDAPGYVSLSCALPGRQLAVYTMQSGAMVLDETGAEIRTLDLSDGQGFAVTESSLFVLLTDAVVEYDLATMQKGRTVSVPSSYSSQIVARPDGTVYVIDSESIWELLPGASEPTRAMALLGSLMGDPSGGIGGFGVRPDGLIVALITEGGTGYVGGRTMSTFRIGGGGDAKNTLAYYTPIDPELVANRDTFTITALRDSNRLRKAVSDFQRLHPELKVNMQVQMGDDDDSLVEDHIRTLNTDLLAGKGGDVIVLDGLPMEKYASRGILKDLSYLLPELDLLPGLTAGSASKDGKVYAVPAQFSFQTLWGNSDIMANIQSLEDLLYAPLEPDQKPLSARTPEDWLRLFYPASEASFRDADGKLHFDTPEFEAFLETLYTLYIEQDEQAQLDLAMGRNFAGNVNRSGFNINEMLSIANGASAFLPMEISGLMQLSTAYSLTGGADSVFMPLPSMDGRGRAYTPSLLVGINAQSSQQALAEEFVKLVFSGDVQESDQMSSLPAMNAALNKLFDDTIEQAEEGGGMRAMFMIPGGASVEIYSPTAEDWAELRKLCDEVDTPATIDETLMDFIVSETANFFDGKASARDAAYAVHQRAWFYLNE